MLIGFRWLAIDWNDGILHEYVSLAPAEKQNLLDHA